MRAFFDIGAAQGYSGLLLREAGHLRDIAGRTGRRGANTDLLAAEALVLPARKFLLQDDLFSAGVRIGALGGDLGADVLKLQLLIAQFAAAIGVEGIQSVFTSVGEESVSVRRTLDHYADVVVNLYRVPPHVNARPSSAPVVREDTFTLEVQVEAGVGGSGKVEIHRQVLADGTVRVTATGEAAALAAIGIGVQVEDRGDEAGATASHGGFVTASWDCPTSDDANRVLARLGGQAGVAVLGGSVPVLGLAVATWAAGSKKLRLPPPNSVEVGEYVDVSGHAQADGAAAKAEVGAEVKLSRSVTVDRSGNLVEKVEAEGKVEGKLTIGATHLEGSLDVTGSIEHDDNGKAATAEFRFTAEDEVGVGDDSNVGAKNRTDVIFKLNARQLDSADGKQLEAALHDHDMHEVQRLLTKMAGASATVETWQGGGGTAELSAEGALGVRAGFKESASYDHWERTSVRTASVGFNGDSGAGDSSGGGW